MKIDRTKKSPNYSSRGETIPDVIVLHTSEGSYKGGIAWLCNPKAEASTHFFVSKQGEVAQLVDIKNKAWGNATTTKDKNDSRYYAKSKNALVKKRPVNANNYTISVELEGVYKKDGGIPTTKQYAALKKLIKHITACVETVYGVKIPLDTQHITSHAELVPNWKPNCGRGVDRIKLIKELKA